MTAFAVIESGGKQYRVAVGEKVSVEKLDSEAGKEVVFDKVLLRVRGEEAEIGAPYLAGAGVSGKVLAQGRGEKKIIFRYHSKTRYRKKKGHRQPFTQVEIVKI